MAFWKDSMINRLSNLTNRNHSAAKISQQDLCSSKKTFFFFKHYQKRRGQCFSIALKNRRIAFWRIWCHDWPKTNVLEVPTWWFSEGVPVVLLTPKKIRFLAQKPPNFPPKYWPSWPIWCHARSKTLRTRCLGGFLMCVPKRLLPP